MSDRFNMELPIELVPGDSSKATQQIGKDAEKAGNKAGESFESAAKKGRLALEKIAPTIKKGFLGGVNAVRVFSQAVLNAGDLASRAFQGLTGIVDTIQQRTDALGRAKFFGVMADEAEVLRKKLSDVKSSMEALNLATQLKSAGFDKGQMATFAQAINVISALSGETKQAVEDGLKAGELSNDALRVLGKSAQEVEAIVAKAQIAAGGRMLSPLEKTQAILKALAPDLSKIEQKMGNLGASNPFRVLLKDLQSIWEQVVSKLDPAMKEFVGIIQKNKQGIISFLSKSVGLATQLAGAFVKMLPYVEKFASIADGAVQLIGKMSPYGLGLSMVKKQAEEQGKIQEKMLEDYKKKHGITEKLRFSVAKETEQKIQQAKTSIAKNGSAARVAQSVLEARQETIARMAEARSMIRNYQALALEATASFGGPVSGALSAFKDSFEKFKVLGSLYKGTLNRLADASESELKRLLKAGKITESQAKAVKLFQAYVRAGEHDLREYLGTEKQVNIQLQAQGSLLQSNAAIAQTQVEVLNQQKDVHAAIKSITKTIELLEGKNDIVSRRKLGILKDTLAQYRAISTQRSTILQLALETAKINKQLEQVKLSTDLMRQVTDLKNATKQVRFELQSLSSREDSVLASQLENLQTQFRIQMSIQDLDRKRIDNRQLIESLEKKIKLAGQSEENIKLLENQVLSLRLQNNELVYQARNQEKIRKLTLAIANINTDFAARRQTEERTRAFQDLFLQRKQVELQLLAVGNSREKENLGLLNAKLALGQARIQIDRRIFDNQQRILELEQKRKALSTDERAVQALDRESAALKKQNSELQKQLALQGRLLTEQQRLFTVGGSMLSAFSEQAVDAAQKIGQAISSATMGLIGAVGNALAGVFEQLVTADKDLARNFGKAVLTALGDMALAFATTFAGISAGKFALGDIVGGLGLASAAATLFAAGGALKGAGTLVGPQTPQKQAASSSFASSGLPGQERREKETVRETYVIVPSDMLGDPLRQARSLSRFVKESERRTLGSRRKLG